MPAVATVVWAVAVIGTGQLDQVIDHWASAVTMLFGGFLAGSTPIGGGAVSYPVFTKALEVPSPVARTFGLCIQAVGMTMASLTIVVSGRRIHRRSAVVGSVLAIVGFLASAVLLDRPSLPFRPSVVPVPWVKASFSIVLAATAVLMVDLLRRRPPPAAEAPWSRRLDGGLVVAALAGGLLSGLTGVGANIVVFIFLVALAGVGPRVALPTAVIIMSAVSIVGFLSYVVLDGQFDLTFAGDRMVDVGGTPADMPARSSDLFGLFLAAVPVVVWGAPLGSLVASIVPERLLVGFVALLAAVEVATTAILVTELREQPALLAYLLVGVVVLPPVLLWAGYRRHTLFGARPAVG